MDQVQIIMISYHRPNDLRKSIESILQNTTHPFHLSIIDNSKGNINNILNEYASHRDITIYHNENNLGKGKGMMRWYNQIMQNSTTDLFISIDSDIYVYNNWLERLIEARRKITAPFAILAPIIMNRPEEWFIKQLKSGFIMHNTKIFKHVIDEVYYNRYTAGPLFLIDRTFFESSGGYSQNQLYGSDDGKLCKAAAHQGRFVGIASNVHVLHLNGDNEYGYQLWKQQHVNTDGDCIGYWDQ